MALRPLQPLSPERAEWEDKVADELVRQGEMPRGDAQGLMEAQPEAVDSSWDAKHAPDAAARALLGAELWTGGPRFCCFCGGSQVRDIDAQWKAFSLQDPGNQSELAEYQCMGACEGRSFWA